MINKADTIIQMASAFQQSRVLLTSHELGIFTILKNKNWTARQVAAALKTDERATQRLMEALCAIGLLKKQKGRFLNTDLSARFLVKDSPQFIRSLSHTANMWNNWSALTQAVRSGKSPLAQRVDLRGKDWLEDFIAAMHEHALKQAKSVISLLDISQVNNVLDVGGGSGGYAMAFLRAKKELIAALFDLPKVISIAKRYITKEGFLNRIKLIPGDYNKDNFGCGYDLIFISAVIHINSPAQNLKLLHKCINALNSGGQMVVQDFIMAEDRTRPLKGAFFALNMLAATQYGDTYTESEVKNWMQEVGFYDITAKNTPFETVLVIGKKK